jgi:hypothetical protein
VNSTNARPSECSSSCATPGDRAIELGRSRIGHVLGQIEDRLVAKIELGRQPNRGRFGHTEPAGHIRERSVDGQCRGRENGGCTSSQHRITDDARDVDRRSAKVYTAAAAFDEVDECGIAGREQNREIFAQTRRTRRDGREIRREIRTRSRERRESIQGVVETRPRFAQMQR